MAARRDERICARESRSLAQGELGHQRHSPPIVVHQAQRLVLGLLRQMWLAGTIKLCRIAEVFGMLACEPQIR
jgi:hypothetical protein